MSIFRGISKKSINLKLVEKYGFLCFTLFCLIPVSIGYFYPSLDGPAHLYNSNLINHFLFGEKTIINEFIEMNSEPVPNWTGHFILTFFNAFLPSFLAEKAVLFSYIVGMAYAFRSLVKTIAPQNYELSFLIFPFIFSSFFFLGFYNFILSLIVLFYTIGFWLRNKDNAFSIKVILKLFLLISITYFSHVFVFGILLFVIGILVASDTFSRLLKKEEPFSVIKRDFFKQAGTCIIASIIPLVLFSKYFFSRGAPIYNYYLPSNELVTNLIEMKMFIGLDGNIEGFWYILMAYILLSLFLISIFLRFQTAIKTKNRVNFFLTLSENGKWLVVALVLLVSYFRSPDSNEFGGFITPRIALLFYFFILIWLVSQPFAKWIKYTTVVLFIGIQFFQVKVYTRLPHSFKGTINEIHELSSLIKPHSVVLPINNVDVWLYLHLSNNLGTEKPMVILENYECEQNYFPLKWNQKTLPTPILSGISIKELPCTKWVRDEGLTGKTKAIDYVFITGDFPEEMDECQTKLVALINEGYTIIYDKGGIKLYQIK